MSDEHNDTAAPKDDIPADGGPAYVGEEGNPLSDIAVEEKDDLPENADDEKADAPKLTEDELRKSPVQEITEEETVEMSEEDIAERLRRLFAIRFVGHSLDMVEKILKEIEESPELTKRYTQADQYKPGSYRDLLSDVFDVDLFEPIDSQGRIAKIQEAGHQLSEKAVDAEGRSIIGKFNNSAARWRPKGDNALSGEEALRAFQRARRESGDAIRVPMMNSGFYVEVAPPTIGQMTTLVTQLENLINRLGYQFGGTMYSFLDFHIRETIWQTVKKCIIDTTLSGWRERNALEKHLLIEDFDALLIAVADAMYPKGYHNFETFCASPKCGEVITMTVALGRLALHDFSKLDEDGRKHMVEAVRSTTSTNVKAYQRRLCASDNIDEESDFRTHRIGDYVLTLRPPSIDTYFRAGHRFMDLMSEMVENPNDPNDIASTVSSVHLRNMLPWIVGISKDLPGDRPIYTEDPSMIGQILDMIRTDVPDAAGEGARLVERISEMKITHIAHPVFECPKCGTVPETPTGFFTIDPVMSFFMMARMRFLE